MGTEEEKRATLAECGIGDWVRLRTGWWRVGQPLAGGVGARPEAPRNGNQPLARRVDLSKRWPAIFDLEEPVLEYESGRER